MLDSNSPLLTNAQQGVAQTATFTGPWLDTGNGSPTKGYNCVAEITSVVGNPNCLLKIQSSPDESAIYDVTIDENGLIDVPGQRILKTFFKNRYFRLVGTFQEFDPGEQSGNSSSSSGVTGANSVTVSAYLGTSWTG